MKKNEIIKHLPITTERLIIRAPTLNDLEEIQAAKIAMWHDLQLWMSWATEDAKGIEATRRFIEGSYKENNDRNLPLAAFCKVTGAFVVSTGLDAEDDDFKTVGTGYWVAKDKQGNGFATEATAAVLKFAFSAAGATKVEICYHEDNEKSQKVIEKLGFTFVRANIKSGKRCLDGMPIDVFDYEMTDPAKIPPYKAEWRC